MFRDFIKEALGSEYQEDVDGLVAVLGNLPFKTKSVGALRAFREDAWTDLAKEEGHAIVGLLKMRLAASAVVSVPITDIACRP